MLFCKVFFTTLQISFYKTTNSEMIFSKVRYSNRIPKILFLFTLLSFYALLVVAQTVPTLPQGYPIEQMLPTTTGGQQQQQMLPTMQPQQRNAGVVGTEGRTITLTDAEKKAQAREDSLKVLAVEEAEGDAEMLRLRKRIFGYKMFNLVNFDPNAAINIPTPNNYVLGANDKLIIDIYGYSQDHLELTINPDGFITVPRAGVIRVSGVTIEDAKRKIASVLSKFYAGLPSTGSGGMTTLNVSLGNVRTIKVHVTGEVVAPGTYTATSLTSLLNLLYVCGGPNEIGTYRKVQVIRGNRVAATLDLYDVLIKGYSDSNILLKDQDIIQVGPFISRIAVEGETKRRGLFELLPHQRLIDAIDYAGGFNQYAYSHRVKVYRNTSRERRILDVMKIDFDRFEMENGDSVVIEKILPRFENLVSIEGAVFRPGEYSLDYNKTISKLIESAEGFKEDALVGRISIVRTNENLALENISVNIADIRAGKSPDIELKREDRIVVASIFALTEASVVRVQGAINNEDALIGVEFPYVKNMTVEDVLIKAGGITEAASLSRIEIVRRKRNVDPTQMDAQISDIYYFDVRPDLSVSSEVSKFMLLPYDEIFVRTSPNYKPQTFVSIEGEVLFPDKYGIKNKDEKISDIIQRAGGLTPQAYVEGASLIRQVQLSDAEIMERQETITDLAQKGAANQVVKTEDVTDMKQETIGINLSRIMQNPGSAEDMILLDGDVVRIPKRLETVRLQGEVLYPTSVKYLAEKRFIDYISESGGFTNRSIKSRSYIIYPNGSVDRTRRFAFVNIYPKVQPGSEIIVPRRTTDAGQQLAQFQGITGVLATTLTTMIGVIGLLRLGGN